MLIHLKILNLIGTGQVTREGTGILIHLMILSLISTIKVTREDTRADTGILIRLKILTEAGKIEVKRAGTIILTHIMKLKKKGIIEVEIADTSTNIYEDSDYEGLGRGLHFSRDHQFITSGYQKRGFQTSRGRAGLESAPVEMSFTVFTLHTVLRRNRVS